MNQEDLFIALVTFVALSCVMSYLWYSKYQQFKHLQEDGRVKTAILNQALQQSTGQISVLEKQVQTLSQDKDEALRKYHVTDTVLVSVNKDKIQQENVSADKIKALMQDNKDLEEKMNLSIGNYQAERRRNLITEKAYIQDALAQLTTLEQNLQASQQAFTKPSGKGTH